VIRLATAGKLLFKLILIALLLKISGFAAYFSNPASL